jgi:hypothetical protein
MRKPVLLIVILCVALSCDRYPDPSVNSLSNYSFYFQTSPGMKFFAGEWVSDSVEFRSVNNVDPIKDTVKVIFEIVRGNGNITVQSANTDKNGLIYTGWKLGSGSFEQILRAKTYDLSGKYLTSTDLVEYGFRNDVWDTCSFSPDGDMMGMVADTVNKFTLMINNNQIYKQGERYYLWEPVNDPALVSPRTINMDRNGVIYVTTWTGELVKSTDHAVSWETCTKPFPDRPYFIYPYISNDNYVWVFAFDHPIKFSKDGGMTWTDLPDGNPLITYGFGDVFRLKDGSLLYHGSGCCSLNRSFDNGMTWTKMETPGYSIKLFVNEKDEIFILSQGAAPVSIYKSTDYGASYSSIYVANPQFITEMGTLFNKWGNFYYVLLPGYGILKSFDLNNFELYWANNNLNNLFIDHNGVLIAKDWNMNRVYYRKNSKK